MKILLQLVALTSLLSAAFIFYTRQGTGLTLSLAAGIGLLLVAGFAIGSLLGYRSRPQLVAKIWLAMVSIGLALLLFDLTAGAMLIPKADGKFDPDPVLHHVTTKNAGLRFETSEFDYVHRTNNLGLRGEDTTLKNESGSYRVLMLGDSFTMGKGVEDEKTFSAILQRSLDARAGQSRFQILNGGVNSYAPILSYLQFRELSPELETDLVVLHLDMSDLLQEQAYRKLGKTDASGQVVAVDGGSAGDEPLFMRIRGWMERHMFFVGGLSSKVRVREEMSVDDVVRMAGVELLQHTLENPPAEHEAFWSDLFESIGRLHALCEERGIEFALTTYPWGHQIGEHEWATGRQLFLEGDVRVSDDCLHRIRAFAEGESIPFFDGFPPFRQHEGELLYYEHDMHWNDLGHEVYAEALEEFLWAAELLPSQ